MYFIIQISKYLNTIDLGSLKIIKLTAMSRLRYEGKKEGQCDWKRPKVIPELNRKLPRPTFQDDCSIDNCFIANTSGFKKFNEE